MFTDRLIQYEKIIIRKDIIKLRRMTAFGNVVVCREFPIGKVKNR
jgi:hypothetical protein